jgi:ABC-2 type transport system permease protein
MESAWHVARKDLRLLMRDPQVLVLQLVMPLLLAVVIGFAMEGVLSGDVRLRMAVVDLDRSEESASFVRALDDQDTLVLQTQRWDRADFTEGDAAAVLDGGKRLAVLVIPAGFSASLEGGSPSSLRLYSDPAQRQFARSVSAVVSGQLQRGTLTEAAVAVGAQSGLDREEVLSDLSDALASPLVSLREEALKAGTSLPSGFDQTVPGFTIMFSMFLANFIFIMSWRERQDYGTWRRVLLTPTPRPAILGGQLLSAYVLGAAQMAVLFTIGWLAFGIELGNAGGLALAVAVFLFIPVALGLVVGVNENYLLTLSLLNLIVILLGAIGGSLVPIFLLPGWMETLASFTPHYWALQAFQDLMFRGASIADVMTNLFVLASFAVVLLAVGLARFSFAK